MSEPKPSSFVDSETHIMQPPAAQRAAQASTQVPAFRAGLGAALTGGDDPDGTFLTSLGGGASWKPAADPSVAYVAAAVHTDLMYTRVCCFTL
jgi:hypothetical protein